MNSPCGLVVLCPYVLAFDCFHLRGSHHKLLRPSNIVKICYSCTQVLNAIVQTQLLKLMSFLMWGKICLTDYEQSNSTTAILAGWTHANYESHPPTLVYDTQ